MAEQPRSPEGFALGIDLGTTYSAAAIVRGTTVEPCVLGTIAAQIPSIVVHRADSEILTGEAAERRAASEPTRTAREFKRRLGDPVPIIVGGTPFGAEALMGELLGAIVRQVTQREGGQPTTIVLTHPANYSEYKRGLLREAARLAGLDLDRVRLITEPEAAAIAYAHQQRIDRGEIIAVYDFGGGTFDAAVVRDTTEGFELIGTPEGMERLGGIDFDQAVLAHVDAVLDGLVSSADATDMQVVAGQARLRDDCRRAKEALSTDTDATIPVSLPGVQTDVRLTRDELEQMVRPRVTETVRALQRTIASAGITPADVSRVLLVGGSSRMPIVAQVVKEALGCPVSVDADPKLTIAIGAALSASPGTPDQTLEVAAGPVSTQPAPAAAWRDPSRPSTGRNRRLVALVAALAIGVLVAVVVVVKAGGGGDSTATLPTTSTTPPAPSSPTAVTPAVSTLPSASTVPEVSTSPSVLAPGTPSGLAENLTAVKGLAFAQNGDVVIMSADPPVLEVSGGKVVDMAVISASDAPVGGIAIGSNGDVFVATPAGVLQIIDGSRKLILDGPVAGLSHDLGPLSLDGGGNLFIADNGSSRIIRLAPDGTLTLVAGTGTPAAAGSAPADGGTAATSDIGRVTGLVVNRDGSLLIADAGLNRVRAVAHDGTITTVAGGGTVAVETVAESSVANGTKATALAFSSVDALAVDRQGRVYVGDSSSHSIIRFGSDGAVDLVRRQDRVTALAISADDALVYSDGTAVWSLAGVAAAA